uniref:Uncharacterized protein n=1 Tax=Arundo donax TaxID=35708 RepID=A0A0A9FNV8_ARUDO
MKVLFDGLQLMFVKVCILTLSNLSK